jgi:hypothetical protein
MPGPNPETVSTRFTEPARGLGQPGGQSRNTLTFLWKAGGLTVDRFPLTYLLDHGRPAKVLAFVLETRRPTGRAARDRTRPEN